MASAHKDSRGWRICYVDPDGNQRSLRPGKDTNKASANEVAGHVQRLVAARSSCGPIDRTTAKWLGRIGEVLRKKLSNAGLIEPRVPVVPETVAVKPTLGEFLADHVNHGRTSQGKEAAPSTIAKWAGTQRFLMEVFGVHKRLDEVTAEDAHQFRVWLDKRRIKQKTAGRRGQPMAENAKRKHIANCKMFFNGAKRRGLIDNNPFEAQVSGSQVNRERDHYITPEDTAAILKAAPDAQWRLLIALWRLAGLRKMEVFNLTWGDVLRDQGKLRVRISKTRHHDGCEMRYVPLRDIGEYLEDAFQAALQPGEKSIPADRPIITRFSQSNSNLDKPFRKIIEAAGLVPWSKLFQNLRSSCETQWLKEGARADLVAGWIGHSVKIQNLNYVQHTDDDIEAFNAMTTSKSGNTGGKKEPRTAAKQPEVATQVATVKPSKNAGIACFTGSNDQSPLPRAGLEPTNENTDFGSDTVQGGNVGGNFSLDSDLIATLSQQLNVSPQTLSEALHASGIALLSGRRNKKDPYSGQ